MVTIRAMGQATEAVTNERYFRVTDDAVLHKRANRNDSQVVLTRIFQCSMS
jgi:hypothetical protein